MKLLKAHEFKSGLRVLLAKPDENYRIGLSNPAVGTEYECQGTITNRSDGTVHWDNGKQNSYKDDELQLVDEGYGKYLSIWE